MSKNLNLKNNIGITKVKENAFKKSSKKWHAMMFR